MNKTLLVGGLAALTLAAGGDALAQQPPEPPHAHGMRADADGDHRLSQVEFVGRRVERLTAADADRDGSVSPAERRAAAEARRAGRADARFDRLDADDDGAITKPEFDAGQEARAGTRAERAPRRAHRGPARRARHEQRMENRGPVVIAEAQARAEATFVRLDADRDGYITVAERRAAHADRREHRRERMSGRRAARQAQQASPPAPASE
ncbi:EF-hand domain-containing protein [Brevundimonas sp.]|uniref:EF-hand domain-containing protein n=1 Tax=Brevundimonas sp. TaxID=1871086 RepID=UPI002D298D11|nr:EF-hand domain-containing protein [Brevundimonas sp.]HYC97386.1 EF-hand domain-containing protein [Brevundimonas sp.]